jgi:hypothetical protein
VFSAVPVHSALVDATIQNMIHFDDLSGDGLPELVMSANLSNSNATPQNYVYSFARNGASIDILYRGTFGEALGTGLASDPHAPWNARRSSFADVNGDGLDDYIYANKYVSGPCESRWAVRLNLGGRFGNLMTVGGANQAGLEMSTIGGQCKPVARDWEAQHATLVSYEDTDGDGRAEILVPRGLKEILLTEAIFADGKNQPAFATVFSPNPRSENILGDPQSDTSSLADGRGFAASYSGGMNGTFAFLSDQAQLDSGSYLMSRLIFKETGDQQFELVEAAMPDALTRQVGSNTPIRSLDMYGDGLPDAISYRGCRAFWQYINNGAGGSSCQGTTPANMRKLLRNGMPMAQHRLLCPMKHWPSAISMEMI